MNVLTDEEIRKWWSSENGLEDCVMCKIDDFEKVVRAIEAAVIKRLAAGVSVEPSFFNVMDGKTAYIPYYTPKQFTTAIAAARVQENERIAQHFDAKPGCEMFGGGIADEIRALLGKEST